MADKLTKKGFATQFVGPEPALGISSRKVKLEADLWTIGQLHSCWKKLSSARQARLFIEAPNSCFKKMLLTFNCNQLRWVVDLLTGHNTLKRHLRIMRLTEDSLCKRCGQKKESSFHVLCRCDALALHRYFYLGSDHLDPSDIRAANPL